MKRAGEERPHPSVPPLLRGSQRTGTPPQGTEAEAALDKPIPGRNGISLNDALQAALRKHPSLQIAVDIILALARNEPLATDVDGLHANAAADLLLELRQAPLLCKLAQQMPGPYALKVGASKERAQVLASIGDSWPIYPTAIHLSTALPGEASASLHTFLKCPATLDVHVDVDRAEAIDDIAHVANATALATALTRRPLREWTLYCPSGAQAAVLEPLCGVAAQSIVLQLAQFEGDRDEDVEKALRAIVTCAGDALDISACALHADFASALITSRPQWQHLIVSADSQQMPSEKMRIAHLEVRGKGLLAVDAAFLAWLASMRVNTLTTSFQVDLGQLAAVASGAWIHRLDACFIVKDGADIEAVLTALNGLGLVEIVHHPQPFPRQGYTHIDADAAARLIARSSSMRMKQIERTAYPQSVYDEAVSTIALNLSEVRDLGDLSDYLLPSNNALSLKVDASAFDAFDPSSYRWQDKLQCLFVADVPNEIVKAAIAGHLHDDPQDALTVCQALIELEGLLLSRPSQEWHSMLRGYLTRWLSDQLALVGVDKTQLLDLISPPCTRHPLRMTARQKRPRRCRRRR